MCRNEVELKPGDAPHAPGKRILCEPCTQLNRAPRCLNCGEPVRGANPRDPEPYHQECRRCSSCYQVVSKADAQKLAGRILCKCCAHLFGQFFLPTRRCDAEHVREAFEAWDTDSSGSIEAGELRRVLKALDPDFADRDVDKLIRSIDTNHNGRIDYCEFTEWIMKGDPLAIDEGEDGFEKFIINLMRAAGKANNQAKMDVAEVQLREDGIYFTTESGDTRLEASSFTSGGGLELTTLDPEEFITKMEATEAGLSMTMNTGRVANLGGRGTGFGPFIAEEGFHVVGLRTKPLDGSEERIVGVDTCPLGNSKSYNAPAALRFAAEHELLQTLRDILAKAAVNVNTFTGNGVTALMLAAQYGNVGAMRLLLQSKANPNLCDEDGWTALTFSSRCGQTSAVKILLEKGATQEGDGGGALSQAIQQNHNSAARALLRAGFGPCPLGTFAVEEMVDPAKCALVAPEVMPLSGNYTQLVKITISHEKLEEGVRLFYTLDGRDPVSAGRRYRGSLALSGEHNFLRVVAVHGSARSPVTERHYRVCHYAMPDEVVSGTLQVRTFPEVESHVITAFANALEVARESVTCKVSQDAPVSGGKCWVRIPITDPTPAHRLHIDRAFTLVKGDAKKKAYLDKFAKDVKKATGAMPEHLQVTAGSIIVDFTLAREPAAELVRQIADPTSFLLTKAKLKASFGDATYDHAENLGDRVCDTSLHSGLHKALGIKATVDEVIGIGQADEGVLAICCPESQVKKIKKPFAMHAAKACQDLGAILGSVLVGPEAVSMDFSIDVVNDNEFGAGDFVKKVNSAPFRIAMEAELSSKGLPDAEVTTKTKATSRELAQLEFHLEWDFPVKPKNAALDLPDYLDGICLVYREDELVHTVDFQSAHNHKRDTTREASQRSKAISRAIQHSGDDMSDTGGQHRMTLDLAALPTDVTDLYFVLAGYDCKDLSLFPNPSVEIIDAHSRQNMMKYTLSSAGSAEAVIMCSLTKAESRKWIVRGLGMPTSGSVKDYEPIKAAISKLQVGYGHWERRAQLVELKVLHKLGRMSQHSSSEFAVFMQQVLSLPVPIFQLVTFFI